MKLIIRATHSESGILFLEQDGAVACMLETQKHKSSESILQTLRLFHERLGDLIDKIDSNQINTDGDSACFIRSEDGTFVESDPPPED